MKRGTSIRSLFLDIGGVLLGDGWDRSARKRAADKLGLDLPEMERRHALTFEAFEEGKLTLEAYLRLVVFDEKRSFTRAQFRRFMFLQSKPLPEMTAFVARLKARYRLRIAAVSNESRELNGHRIRRFGLDRLVDCFISSCVVRTRKPDVEMFRLALDIAQVPAGQVAYIENTLMFVQIAEGLGIRSILHTDYRTTRAKLASLGLRSDRGRDELLKLASTRGA